MALSSREISIKLFVDKWDKHMAQMPDKRSYGFYSDKTGIHKSTIRRAHKGEVLLKKDAAFNLMEYICGEPINALNFLSTLPEYKTYADRHLALIKRRGGISNSSDRISAHISDLYSDLLVFLAVPRTKNCIINRKGLDSIDLVDRLLELDVIEKLDDKFTTKSFHIPDLKKIPELMGSHLNFFKRNPTLLHHALANIKPINNEQFKKIDKILSETIDNISNIGSDNKSEAGVAIGIYMGSIDHINEV